MSGRETRPEPTAAPAPVRRNPAVNVLWNWAGVGVEAVAGFVIAPLLIHGLGDETYGLWILIGSMTGCFGMLDLGMRGAVGRFVAYHQAKNDQAAVERVLSTAAVALTAVALLSLVLTGVFAWALPRIYSIPSGQVAAVQSATIIVGVQLALFFVLRMFDATLWAYQRFDLLNLTDIPSTIFRAVLIGWLVSSGGGLITLAWISLGTVVVSGLAKCWLTFCATPGLRIRVRSAERTMLWELVGYGFWNLVIRLAALARNQLSPLLVGGIVGLPAVAPFSIVMRLPTMALTILAAATGVFAPVAVAIHANEDNARRQGLLIEGTRLGLSLALYFVALFFWLGKPLLSLWIRPDFAEHWPLLVVIGCGEVLPMAMSVATGMILAMARNRPLAYAALAETGAALCLAGSLAKHFGLLGFVIALAVLATFCRGVYVLYFACRLLSINPLKFVGQTLTTPFACVALACVPLHIASLVYPPTTWTVLVSYAALFSVLFATSVASGVIGFGRTIALVRRLWPRRYPTCEMVR
jgi:O-antigen/teichoic acid export membrane protein